MSRAVSVVLPCLDDRDLLERNLPPLLAALGARGTGDQVLVVDDTGRAVLAPWVSERFPSVDVLSLPENRGFAGALLAGITAARHELVFSMNPDVRVHPGFLDPLVEVLQDPSVHSAAPRVLLHGDENAIESVTEIRLRRDVAEVGQPGFEGRAAELSGDEPFPVAYAIGGTCLLRKSEFVAAGGFDPLYEPFYWEDVDLGWMAWRSGRRVLYHPRSVVEHHHRGTIRRRVREELVRAVIERNRLLFQWKVLDTPELLERHVLALYRMAVDAWLSEQREELVWLLLALDRLEECLASRRELPAAQADFAAIQRATASPR